MLIKEVLPLVRRGGGTSENNFKLSVNHKVHLNPASPHLPKKQKQTQTHHWGFCQCTRLPKPFTEVQLEPYKFHLFFFSFYCGFYTIVNMKSGNRICKQSSRVELNTAPCPPPLARYKRVPERGKKTHPQNNKPRSLHRSFLPRYFPHAASVLPGLKRPAAAQGAQIWGGGVSPPHRRQQPAPEQKL